MGVRDRYLAGLRAARPSEGETRREALARSETLKAAGLAAATLAANGLALVFTVVFARILGATGYGSLAALLSTFLILSVPGSALQVATARETALGRLGDRGELAGTLARWINRLVVALLVLSAVAALLRAPIGGIVGVHQHWAAAATVPTGCLWLILSIERGALQGLHAYKAVGLSIIIEAFGRLVLGLVLVAVGLDVTGGYLGTPLSMLVTAIVLLVVLRRRLGPPAHATARTLRSLISGAWAPVIGLTLIAVLQNIDVIVVKHRIGGDGAGSYAAAAVAAKLVIWVAIGIGLYLLPEATRRAAAGEDARPVLLRALAIIGVVAAPALAIFALAPKLLLKLAFGPHLVQASSSLVVLGAAMTLLAVAYLAVQYMLALGHFAFLYVLGVVALIEPFLLSTGTTLLSFATFVFGLQLAAAVGVLTLALRARA